MTNEMLFWLVLSLIFLFALTNGFLDGGGLLSTVITARTMDPIPALLLVVVFEIAGLFLLGHAVTHLLGSKLIALPADTGPREILVVLMAALSGALGWNLIMWRAALPTSSSHALLGGLIGAAWVGLGKGVVQWPLVFKLAVGLGLLPLASSLMGMGLARLVYWGGQFFTPAVNGVVRFLHGAILAGLAMAHGSNDGQKSLALVLLALTAYARMGVSDAVPLGPAPMLLWFCGGTLAFGIILGSRRTIQTVGRRFYRVQSLQGLCAESTAMLLVGVSSWVGFPVSSSHVMSSAVLGAGAAVRPRGVRWGVAQDIAVAWIFTIPAAACLAAFLGWGMHYVVS